MPEATTSAITSATDPVTLTPAELARVLPEVGSSVPRTGSRRLRARRWSQRLPALYPMAVRYHRARQRLEWLRSDGLLIRPGETFSFNKLVGNATRRKGYLKGMRLSNGQARPGIGGGICQLANLLHWMVLHSPMTVTQRSTHSFDPFPDNGRVLPWGVGCSIVYNYVDLQFRNDTDRTFQLRVGVGERYLEGEILADEPTSSSYRVFARGERFLRAGAKYFRRNEIWRTVIDRRTGTCLGDELIRENVALVKYVPTDAAVVEIDLQQLTA